MGIYGRKLIQNCNNLETKYLFQLLQKCILQLYLDWLTNEGEKYAGDLEDLVHKLVDSQILTYGQTHTLSKVIPGNLV